MRIAWTIFLLPASAVLVFVAGCPRPTTLPAVQQFNSPGNATLTRVSNGQEIVFVQTNQANGTFDFFLARPGEAANAHQLIASVPATNLGFAAGQQLVLPRSISFSDNLQRGVVGFANGSFLLNGGTPSQTPPIQTFAVTPIIVLGGPVFAPTISPLGDQFAFETATGQIAMLNTTNFMSGVINPVVLGTGVSPVFGSNGTLGFANPSFTNFFVNDFTQGTVDTFNLTGFSPFPTPFSTFESGLTPSGIGNVGTFVGTSPLVM